MTETIPYFSSKCLRSRSRTNFENSLRGRASTFAIKSASFLVWKLTAFIVHARQI
ncbi:hypothetical protein DINO107042_05795 [Dichelobacter nodosus]